MVRFKKVEDETVFDGKNLEMKWDFKRIIIGLLLAGTFFGFGVYFLSKTGDKIMPQSTKREALGISSQKNSEQGGDSVPSLPTKEDVSHLLEQTQQEISKLTAENLTSSQAAIQEIIQDLQSLSGGKKSPTDFFCEFVCKK